MENYRSSMERNLQEGEAREENMGLENDWMSE
jgi:hypothetical protein